MSRKRNEEPEGFLPREEAPRKDDKWTGEELDHFYDYILDNGQPSSIYQPALHRYAQQTGRSIKSLDRKFEQIKFAEEENTFVFSYKATKRKDRRGLPMQPIEREVIEKHMEDSVQLKRTSEILQRSYTEIFNVRGPAIKRSQK